MKECTLDRVETFWKCHDLERTGFVLRNSVSKEFRESSNASLWDPMYHVSLALSFFFFCLFVLLVFFLLFLETPINGLT